MNKILLIDGNALLYKAFWASFKSLEQPFGYDASGNPINALRTFSSMMLNIRKMFDEHDVLIAFDQKDLKTFRSEHSFYKDGRQKTPQELISQKPLIEEFIDLFGYQQFSHANLEADDIIGVLAKKFNSNNQVDIITSDKDLLQLVDQNINVHLSKTGVTDMDEFNIENFAEKMEGLSPNQIPDLKGMMGDSSDNLKGIKGIGPKTSYNLLNEYGTLENIFENLDNLTDSVRTKFEQDREHGFLCKSIATIITDFDLDINEETIKVSPIRKQELIKFFEGNRIYNLAKKVAEEW